ncbi:hypothetical protein SteCoe_23625 [Stentor coeruleus]|uniref:Uncharacterized protein n=1 Tax=Stentor coeruleus TaxID=5963 RepID=A0A1R2BJF9_9CILI|nr:hypothetical protein SteCoe_23625 [Stentor coeruleus]
MESLQDLKIALEAEKHKNRLLEEKLRMKSFENEMIKRQAHLVPPSTSKMPLNRKDQESLLIALEREEEYVNNTLRQSLQRLVQEKIDIENALEQEQEFIVNTMSRQLAKALNDKFQATKRTYNSLETGGIIESEEIITDSSFSSDSENSRDVYRGKQQIRILETNLTAVKQQIHTAKSEIKRYKEMYLQLKSANKLLMKDEGYIGKNMSESDDTDRSSEFSCGSLSSRSMGLDTSQDSNAASRENSSTPKPRYSKM